MAYLRFVVPNRHPDSGVEEGLFGVAYSLRDSTEISNEHRQLLIDHLKWFAKNLAVPERFNRSASKGYYRRNAKGIAWFRESALEHISRMRELKRIVEANGHVVTQVSEDRIGYIVYEDPTQVIAEPFADTRTRA